MSDKKQILLLEDDVMIASGIEYALANEGYEVKNFGNVANAKESIESEAYVLGLLDMQLPDGNGFQISELLKQKDIPVIFLTIVDDESKIVKAFEEGADDYIVKPFRIRELIARVKRTIGKREGMNQEIITLGKANIHVSSGKVFVGEEQIELTALEYRLLLIFAKNKAQLLTRAQILEQLWDIDGNFVEDNTLTVYVKRLREKLKDAIQIETVRGIGYRVD